MTCMQVLLTNDDGVDAEGLRAVRAVLAECSDRVITVAPAADCSGFARRCTYSRPVAVTRVGGGRHPVYRLDGTPADCVRAGLLGGLAARADLVVSGINHGANLADDVAYSGTVAAGLEAAILGGAGRGYPGGGRIARHRPRRGPGRPRLGHPALVRGGTR